MSVIITFQKYVRPQSLEEAWELNQKKRHRIVAGMMWLKMGKHSFGTAIDLCDLGLDKIEETERVPHWRYGYAAANGKAPWFSRLFLRCG